MFCSVFCIAYKTFNFTAYTQTRELYYRSTYCRRAIILECRNPQVKIVKLFFFLYAISQGVEVFSCSLTTRQGKVGNIKHMQEASGSNVYYIRLSLLRQLVKV